MIPTFKRPGCIQKVIDEVEVEPTTTTTTSTTTSTIKTTSTMEIPTPKPHTSNANKKEATIFQSLLMIVAILLQWTANPECPENPDLGQNSKIPPDFLGNDCNY